MLRKRDQRADDKKHLTRICELFDISLSPKKTLTHRSEHPCVHRSIHVIEEIVCFLVRLCVEELVRQRRLDDALRRRLEAGEADLAALRGELARDPNDTAGGSDIGPSHGFCPMGRDAD